jgi:hypothetical protein
VRAELPEQAVFDDGDAVGVRRVEPVRDRDHRAPVEHRPEPALEMARRPRVEQRGCLVEDERVGIGEDEPGERELLGLWRRERLAAGPDRCLEPVRERARPLERVHRPKRSLELGVRRGPLPQVALRCALQIPTSHDPDCRYACQERQRSRRAHPDRGHDRERGGHGSDQRLGDREADRARERVDVCGGARDEIARSRPLDGRERQGENTPHEVLA